MQEETKLSLMALGNCLTDLIGRSNWIRCQDQESKSGHNFTSSSIIIRKNKEGEMIGSAFHVCTRCGLIKEQVVEGLIAIPRTREEFVERGEVM